MVKYTAIAFAAFSAIGASASASSGMADERDAIVRDLMNAQDAKVDAKIAAIEAKFEALEAKNNALEAKNNALEAQDPPRSSLTSFFAVGSWGHQPGMKPWMT